MNHDAAEIPLKRDPDTGLFIWWLEDDREHSLDLSILSQEERQRASRYRIIEKQRQFLFTRWAGRLLFAEELGVSPNDVVWPAQGVPKVTVVGEQVPQLSVSISHTRNHTFIAIGPRKIALGIDVEPVVRQEDISGIAAAALTQSERQLLQECSPKEQPDLLTGIWTIKEAVLKSLQLETFPDWRSIQVELGPERRLTTVSAFHPSQHSSEVESRDGNVVGSETLESLLMRTKVEEIFHPSLRQSKLTGNLALRARNSSAMESGRVQLTLKPLLAGTLANFAGCTKFSKFPYIRLCQGNVIISE